MRMVAVIRVGMTAIRRMAVLQPGAVDLSVSGRPLDSGEGVDHASGMSESPYAIPEEDLLDTARVPVAEQFIEQPERRFFGDTGGGTAFFGEADGDGE
jgi:hypothetical protein